jgi:hypothetical protein
MRRATLLLSVTILCGCGGIQDALKGAEANLSVTPETVSPGQSFNVRWGGNKLTGTKSNNFKAPSGLTSGQITDRTAVDLTYSYVAYGQNGSNPEIELTAKATVRVAKSRMNVWVLGDPATAGPNQVADYLKSITTGVVRVLDRSDTTTTVPVEDLVVVHPSYFLPSDGSSFTLTLQGMSKQKRKVIIIGETSLKYFGGSNLSSIGGLLGGATGVTQDFLATERIRSEDGSVPISIAYRGTTITLSGGGGRGVAGVGGSADRLISTGIATQAFTYVTPDGARFAFAMRDGVGSSATDAWYEVIIQSMARWCMDMS